MNKKLSPTMQTALDYIREHGNKITRKPGGFWMRAEGRPFTEKSFGTTTIEALVERGRLVYTQWQHRTHRSGKFPIEASVPASAEGKES